MAINTIDDIASGLASSQKFNFQKTVLTALKSIGSFASLWTGCGIPSYGDGPPIWNSAGSGVFILSGSATAGTFTIAESPTLQRYLARFSASTSIGGTLIIADRLWAAGGFGFSANGSMIPNPWNLPDRITDSGCGCELWMEVYKTAMGNTTGSLTAIYTNPAGTGSRIGTINALVSAPAAMQMQPVQLQRGDYGIKQLNGVALSATHTSGSFGMTIIKRLAEISLPTAGTGNYLDWASISLPIVSPSACLMFIWQGAATTAPVILGSMDIVTK